MHALVTEEELFVGVSATFLQEFSQNFLQRGVLNCDISKLHNMFPVFPITILDMTGESSAFSSIANIFKNYYLSIECNNLVS